MPDIDLVPEDVREDDFGHISRTESECMSQMREDVSSLLLLVPVQISVCNSSRWARKQYRMRHTFEPLADISHLLVDPLLLEFPDACTTDIRNELFMVCVVLRKWKRGTHLPASSLACSWP